VSSRLATTYLTRATMADVLQAKRVFACRAWDALVASIRR
jgi:hypothetical protein